MKHCDDELELQDKCYHIEMLRLWEETTSHVKISYCMDKVEQEMVCIFCQYSIYNNHFCYYLKPG